MLFVVAYDISDDGTRTEVADELANWGHRVQYSVFECNLDDGRRAQLAEQLRKFVSSQDSIRIYRVCQACVNSSFSFGGKAFAEDTDFYQV